MRKQQSVLRYEEGLPIRRLSSGSWRRVRFRKLRWPPSQSSSEIGTHPSPTTLARS